MHSVKTFRPVMNNAVIYDCAISSLYSVSHHCVNSVAASATGLEFGEEQ